MHKDHLPHPCLSPDHFYFLDEFNIRLSELTCGKMMFDYDQCVEHNVNIPHCYFHQGKRPRVRYTAIMLKHDVTLISSCYQPSNTKLSLVIMSIDEGRICFNGVWLSKSQIALVSAQSSVPFVVNIPAYTRVLLAEIDDTGKQLREFSNALIPLDVNQQYMNKLRITADITDRGQLENSPLGGTRALLKLTTELQQQVPPLRPQSLKGRSRLPRKVLIPKIVSQMEQDGITPFSLNRTAEALNISTKTINQLFKHYTGFAPKRFYLLMKLFAFRQELQKPATESVIQAASNINIDGWSRYAARYQRLFAETPNKTYQSSHKQQTDTA
ncbi:helix-turn-helix domain-containing protein [Moritella dasanensis]|uniref:helix-turn-helix domain-containing protein n=1 Tax=Moritella dasanensis TaxID=428031 RepID=UPI0002D89E91|nr:helix-turn-helix domain-containing protein [Moritella dasanensis]